MKKLMGIVLGLCLLCVLAVQAGAEETHSHCVCGGAAVGVGDHTACETVSWTPLSQALEAVGSGLSKADFGKLPSGFYYLDGDVTVAGSTSIGTHSDELKTTPDTVTHLTICLNGHSISRKTNQIFGAIQMESTLTICDCSYKNGVFGGTVTGGVREHGSVLYGYSASTVSIYGGNFVGNATKNGGVLCVGNDGCGDLDGNGKYEEADRGMARSAWLKIYNGTFTGCDVTGDGGAIKVFHGACMDMYGGTVIGGTAGGSGGSISVGKGTARIYGGTVKGGTAARGGNLAAGTDGAFYITGGTVTGGTAAGTSEVCQVIGNDGKLLGTYTDLAKGIVAAQDQPDRYLRLVNDTVSGVAVSGTLYLDLSGHDLSGIHITGTLYGMDSTTNGYDDSQAGILTPASGAPALHVKTPSAQTGFIRRYLAVEQGGTYSFHRFYMGITKYSLKPATVGVGYKAAFAGTETVKNALSSSSAFGYSLQLGNMEPVTRSLSASYFGPIRELTLRVDNFLDPALSAEENRERAQLMLAASPYICLADGTVLQGSQISVNMRDMVEKVDGDYASYTPAQQEALQKLSADHSETMLSWDMANTHHAQGGIWEPVTRDGFLSKLTVKNGIYYIPTGNYVLTENFNMDGVAMRVNTGNTVRICLNGHTFSGNTRLFRLYGNLDICDCHTDGSEGTMVSSLSGDTKTYAPIFYAYYGANVNLYGGNLVATGKVCSAGVVAVSHDGTGVNADSPSAVFNIYGGSISGGQVYDNGGLISIWNGATVNMYGGTLYGGSAGAGGGGINYTGKCSFNMYGGTIRDCTAGESGGNIHAASNTVISLLGGTITGGSAPLGSGVYAGNCTVTLGGDIRILENENTDLYTDVYTQITSYELAEDASVGIYSQRYRVLSEKPEDADHFFSNQEDYAVKSINGQAAFVAQDMVTAIDTTGFTVGFGTVSIMPKTIAGTPLGGYGNGADRLADDQTLYEYDELIAQAVAITDENGKTVLIIACDVVRGNATFTKNLLTAIHAATGVPEGDIIVNCSHSHSTPELNLTGNERIKEYYAMVPDLFARACYDAMQDRKPATMETGSFEVSAQINGKTRALNFVRHYSYVDADGVLQYFGDNFGTAVYNDTTQHIWTADPTMYLIRFNREGQDILMANWRIHPHRTGGSQKYKMSADVIGTLRYYMGQKLEDTHFVYIQGAAGNINSISKMSSDNHGLDYVEYGEVLAGVIVDNLGCLEDTPTGVLQTDNISYTGITNRPTQEEYEAAVAMRDLANSLYTTIKEKNSYCKNNSDGRYESYYEVSAIITRYTMEDSRQLPLNVISLGNSIGFYSAPGELWDTVSIEMENRSPFPMTICLGYTAEQHNYFLYYPDYVDTDTPIPYKSYESSTFKYLVPNTVLDLMDYWTERLNEFYANVS